MARYFEPAKAIVERHGGTVEKFIGDAVMAVFGVPVVHEDDALRRRARRRRAARRPRRAERGARARLRHAPRAADRRQHRRGRHRHRGAARDRRRGQRRRAPRAGRAAGRGAARRGDAPARARRGRVRAGRADPARRARRSRSPPTGCLRAARRPAAATRRADGRAGAPARRCSRTRSPRVVDGRSCHLFTILGAPASGSRGWPRSSCATLDGATVVRGRCLSYGEGITYWPVAEVLKQPRCGDSAEAEPALASILGDDSAASSPTEIAWAFRKLLEALAAERPLVVVFDDIHWGEPAFLDLIEHVADLSRDAPILLLCMARPELLDLRPTWGGGKLERDERAARAARAGGGRAADRRARRADRPRAARRGSSRRPSGNPLFVEEMVAMAEDGGEIVVPPTIQALLAARLDQLEPAERGVLERGAVEGRVFHRGAVAALAPEEPTVDGRLITLVRKDLVRPEPTVFAGRRRLPLPAPADPRRRLRGAAEGRAGRAARALRRPGSRSTAPSSSSSTRSSATTSSRRTATAPSSGRSTTRRARRERAAVRLREAPNAPRSAATSTPRGVCAAGRGAPVARASVCGMTQLELAVALVEIGEFESAEAHRDEAAAAARAAQDEGLLARCELARAEAQIQADQSATMQAAIASAREQLAVLERLGDEEGAVWALRQLASFTAWPARPRRRCASTSRRSNEPGASARGR